ncbi:putative phospholipase B-like 1 [Macrosteles quadrilineatus]|uniref:putative phospholipase B-like 1 n=1 Tax=Macrosteles quadrilineatus TaxID=74068 RepID=UPI0023E1E5FB|nr:putative phospholipase B-like 1 [Macrosteles quadrilineatus]
MLRLIIVLPFLSHCILIVQGKFSKKVFFEDGMLKGYAYKETKESNDDIMCALFQYDSYNETGWSILEAQSNQYKLSDVEQAQCVGELEGAYTADAIYIQYFNNIKSWCKGRKETCKKVYSFLDQHLEWTQQEIKDRGDSDPIWHHVDIFFNHITGLYTGYQEVLIDPKKNLTLLDFIVMNLQPDLDDVADALEGDVSSKVRGDTRCSAIVKLVSHNQDLLVGHNTWTTYSQMYRQLKKYNMPLHKTGKSKSFAPTRMISFSGYPGVITSQDDFYTTSSRMVVLETTIGNYNASRWQYVTPTGQLFDSVRSLIAMRLADSGRTWSKTFSQYNSGTYNNQWMIVDLKKFKKGMKPKPGTLWILEQIPGYIRYEDQTSRLVSQGYWPSYNVPFYKDVFDLSGNQELVDKYGDWFSYDKTPRALIFHRNQSSVTDLDSLMKLLRYNNYKNDPHSVCNCTPPYSAENAIAARSDLNPKKGRYPFPALGHRCHGAIDAKVTSSELVHNLTFKAISGPTTGNNLPLFRWSTSDFKHLPHMGQPDSFQFDPLTWQWWGPFF